MHEISIRAAINHKPSGIFKDNSRESLKSVIKIIMSSAPT